MLICYCEKCGMRVPEADLANGRAMRISDSKAYCVSCSPAVSTVSISPGRLAERLTSVGRSSRRRGEMPAETSEAPPLLKRPWVLPAAGGVGVVLLGLVFWLMRAPTPASHAEIKSPDAVPKEVKKEQKPEIKTTTKPSGSNTEIAKTPPSTTKSTSDDEEYTTQKKGKSREQQQQEVDAEMATIRHNSAARQLDGVKKMFAENPGRIFEYRDRLDIIVTRHKGTPAAAEAAKLLAGLKLPEMNTTASFVKKDTETAGNWRGVYGADGRIIIEHETKLPPYVSVRPEGHASYVWKGLAADDKRALQTDGGRMLGCWYATNEFVVNIDIVDGKAHQMAVYIVTPEIDARAQTVEIIDPDKKHVFDKQQLPALSPGTWYVWNVSGRVQIKVTLTGKVNCLINGIFFDPVKP